MPHNPGMTSPFFIDRSSTALPRLTAVLLFALGAACSGNGTPNESDGSDDDGDGDESASGGMTSGGTGSGSGGAPSTPEGSGGEHASGGSVSGSGGVDGGDLSRCGDAGLVWKTARKTTYTSYPEPDSEECVVYNGCMWAGWFAGCQNQQSEAWVESHNIAAVFPLGDLSGHEICIKSGDKQMIVTVVDTCGDSDCDGCCTQNKGANDALVDLESFTNARWGLADSIIDWADLGPGPAICE